MCEWWATGFSDMQNEGGPTYAGMPADCGSRGTERALLEWHPARPSTHLLAASAWLPAAQ
jgi:hypothetical protein